MKKKPAKKKKARARPPARSPSRARRRPPAVHKTPRRPRPPATVHKKKRRKVKTTTTTATTRRTVVRTTLGNPVSSGELATVIVKRSHPKAKTRAQLRHIVQQFGGVDLGYDGSADAYHFPQHRPPRRFKSYRSVKVTPYVTLVYGRRARDNPRRVTIVDVRENPVPMHFGAPVWMTLRHQGKLSKHVRELTRGKAGAYMIREAGKGPILYIGETHTAIGFEKRTKKARAMPQRLRWWKTIVRHVYPWEWNYDPRDPRYKDPDKRPDEWVYKGNHDLEIALYPAPSGGAKTLEGQLVLEYRPIHNRKAFVPVDELEEAPF